MQLAMKSSTKLAWLSIAAVGLSTAAVCGWLSASDNSSTITSSAVLVELFTSEGCSSCPPADSLLEQLDQQKIAGVQVIPLSEHVDYWDHEGWKDPYSSSSFTDRQRMYQRRFRLAEVYTPQIVVDGVTQCLGSDRQQVVAAIEDARKRQKTLVRMSAVSANNSTLAAHVEADPLAESGQWHKANLYLVVALNHAKDQVRSGENKGRDISNVAVVQSFQSIGGVEKGKGFSRDVRVKLKSATDPANLRVIAFVQDPGSEAVLGVSEQQLPANTSRLSNRSARITQIVKIDCLLFFCPAAVIAAFGPKRGRVA